MKLVFWNGWAMQPGAFAPLARELPDAAIQIPSLAAPARCSHWQPSPKAHGHARSS